MQRIKGFKDISTSPEMSESGSWGSSYDVVVAVMSGGAKMKDGSLR